MIIAYYLGYSERDKVECCGDFRDLSHFRRFESVENYYRRYVYSWRVVSR